MSHAPAFTNAAGGSTHMPAFVNAGGGAGRGRYWNRLYPARYWNRLYPSTAGSGGVVHPHMPAFTNVTGGSSHMPPFENA